MTPQKRKLSSSLAQADEHAIKRTRSSLDIGTLTNPLLDLMSSLSSPLPSYARESIDNILTTIEQSIGRLSAKSEVEALEILKDVAALTERADEQEFGKVLEETYKTMALLVDQMDDQTWKMCEAKGFRSELRDLENRNSRSWDWRKMLDKTVTEDGEMEEDTDRIEDRGFDGDDEEEFESGDDSEWESVEEEEDEAVTDRGEQDEGEDLFDRDAWLNDPESLQGIWECESDGMTKEEAFEEMMRCFN